VVLNTWWYVRIIWGLLKIILDSYRISGQSLFLNAVIRTSVALLYLNSDPASLKGMAIIPSSVCWQAVLWGIQSLPASYLGLPSLEKGMGISQSVSWHWLDQEREGELLLSLVGGTPPETGTSVFTPVRQIPCPEGREQEPSVEVALMVQNQQAKQRST
jgi:hypothetical protein